MCFRQNLDLISFKYTFFLKEMDEVFRIFFVKSVSVLSQKCTNVRFCGHFINNNFIFFICDLQN